MDDREYIHIMHGILMTGDDKMDDKEYIHSMSGILMIEDNKINYKMYSFVHVNPHAEWYIDDRKL